MDTRVIPGTGVHLCVSAVVCGQRLCVCMCVQCACVCMCVVCVYTLIPHSLGERSKGGSADERLC